MPWIAVDESGDTFIYTEKPHRINFEGHGIWTSPIDDELYVDLPLNFMEMLLGKVLTWTDEPMEIGKKE
jgi:hypothetical protein